tara:strand:+ start:2428 stop:3171 length:744 start_codon:yes stop_codon:yes gene_type:complete
VNKEFGNLSEDELADCIAMFQEIENTFFDEDSIRPMEEGVLSWGSLYELPFEHVISLAVVGLNIQNEFLEAAQTDNPQRSMIELAREHDTSIEDNTEPEPWFVPVLIATIVNLRSFSKYQASMFDLVTLADGGDITSMLKAIRLDPMSIYADPIARIHSNAIACHDTDLLKLIQKALAGKSPRLPGNRLSGTRMAIQFLQESGALSSLTVEQLRELIVDRLDLYPSDGDSHSAIRSAWRENKRLRGD